MRSTVPDVDECGTELAKCASNTYCFNTDGSYECRGRKLVASRGLRASGTDWTLIVLPELYINVRVFPQDVTRHVWGAWAADQPAVRSVPAGTGWWGPSV